MESNLDRNFIEYFQNRLFNKYNSSFYSENYETAFEIKDNLLKQMNSDLGAVSGYSQSDLRIEFTDFYKELLQTKDEISIKKLPFKDRFQLAGSKYNEYKLDKLKQNKVVAADSNLQDKRGINARLDY